MERERFCEPSPSHKLTGVFPMHCRGRFSRGNLSASCVRFRSDWLAKTSRIVSSLTRFYGAQNTRKPAASLLRSVVHLWYNSRMTMPPTYLFRDLGHQTQMMARNCENEKLAMALQYVALGSMIVMTGYAASEILKDVFGDRGHDRGHGRSR